MTVRHKLQNNPDGFRRQQEMGAQTPEAAGGNATLIPADHPPYHPLPPTAVGVEGQSLSIGAAGQPWDRSIKNQEASSYEEKHGMKHGSGLPRKHILVGKDDLPPISMPTTHFVERPIPDQLVELIMNMTTATEAEVLGDAFLHAQLWPPITKQSLSELDIQNIITNIKLRHDVNFDRDLSFRPNNDGIRGQEKEKASNMYWLALVAELVLYMRFFQGTPLPFNSNHSSLQELTSQTKKRIPNMFHTIQDVLKSLVPDRDHSRVDEYLDVPVLMQRIEKGVVDLPRLAEWLSHLLKEHCAPMRDDLVDSMVEFTRSGVARNDLKSIVKGLRELLGILEAMKLDVANHQIRNLKTLLIEDTINFERHYHLDRLVKGQAHVNIEAAQQWYTSVLEACHPPCTPPKDNSRFQLEVFGRAVVSTLFSMSHTCKFPDTFYLDRDRFRQIKLEIDDMVFLNICFEMFGYLQREFGYNGPISSSRKHALRVALSAVLGAAGQGISQWTMNCENISLELIRQALSATGQQLSINADLVQRVSLHLNAKFRYSFSDHVDALKRALLPQILASTNRHLNSSPMELFNAFVTLPSPPPPPYAPSQLSGSVQSNTSDTSSSHSEQMTEVSNRISHIILLHWRIWAQIAYVPEETPTSKTTSEETLPMNSPPPPAPSPSHLDSATSSHVVPMKTGEPRDAGQEPQFTTHRAPS
ncbi:hypothetical protein CC78DRAFT_118661 [Lojkania enalia]|uniref:Uncharacterized protein n=1 Tax=Lojkania enalia TaxID=147567 RepID=A0A9P4KEC8_9PLEO|nr:hypothetical protein CC78DRAFT_118661 [Didymosphaeria enalia]